MAAKRKRSHRAHRLLVSLSDKERALVEAAIAAEEEGRKQREAPYSLAGVMREQVLAWAQRVLGVGEE